MCEVLDRRAFVIDPELLVPDSAYIGNLSFWGRFNEYVSDITDYVLLGEMSGILVDEFLDEILSKGPDVATDGIYNNANFYSVLDVFNRIHRVNATGFGDYDIQIDKEIYSPIFGSDQCRLALQFDIVTTNTSLIIGDKRSWSSFSGESHIVKGVGEIYDIKAGLSVCVRRVIENNISFLACKCLSKDAFPRLRFAKHAWDFCAYFSSNELSFAPILLRYLSGLNDYALDIWEQTVEPKERETRMKARRVVCSPEKTETMQIDARRKERTFVFDDKPIPMTWHLKYTHDKGRMYFFVDVKQGYVVIGGNTEHFPTDKSDKHRKRVAHKGRG